MLGFLDYPAEIRAVRKQLPQQERTAFIRDYKGLSPVAKEQFKNHLKNANFVEAGKLVNRDLSSCQAPVKTLSAETPPTKDPQPALSNVIEQANLDLLDNVVPLSIRFQNIISTYSDDIDTTLVAEASKKYDNISGWSAMNIKERTHSILNLSS